nr:CRISPR-associated helicase Cas3' [Campylobacter curvus]
MLPTLCGLNNFWELLKIAIIFHDLGKSAKDFQNLMKNLIKSYNFRHEWLSGSILLDLDMPKDEKELVLNAILSHHKNFKELKDRYKKCQSTKEMIEDGDEIDLKENRIFEKEIDTLDFAWIKLYLENFKIYIKNFTKTDPLAFAKPLPKILQKWTTTSKDSIGEKEKWQNIFLSASLSICDHNASANLDRILILKESNFEFLNTILKPFKHQQDSWSSQDNILLIAPTGQGKTESALGWLRNQLKNRQGRAFYLLPFTASINAMVRRVSKNFKDDGLVGLLHAKAKFFIDEFYEKKDGQTFADIADLNKKVYKPLKVATPYQILKWAFGVKGFEKGLTELAGSYLIIDEIHVYNDELYQNMLFFLEWLIKKLCVKIFIMSATLPTFIQKQLESELKVKIIKPQIELLQNLKRHRISLIESKMEDKILEYINGKNLKILIVCNTVSKAQEIYNLLGCYDSKIMLHSRFNAADRVRIEDEILTKQPKILIGTQAIEVSLNIDYDVIFSEIAPLDSLLQRFGRVYRGRRIKPDQEPNCFIFTDIDPIFKKIYTRPNVLENTLNELRKHNEEQIDEEKVQTMLDNVYEPIKIDENEKIIFFKMLDGLYPYNVYEDNEEQFDSQFDGVEVLPCELESKFDEYISKGRFLEAEKLLVPISKTKFHQYKKYGYISSKLKKGYVKMVCLKYDNELGLLEAGTCFD